MRRQIRVGALQLAAHDREQFSARTAYILNAAAKTAADTQLLVLPEATIPAYVLGDDRIDDSEVQAALESLQNIAQREQCVIVAGAAVRRNASLFNSAIVIDNDGMIAGSAEKVFLWHFDRKWFSPGTRLEPVDTKIGRLGAMICADGRMPGIASTLAHRGAELFVMPTAWVTSGRSPDALENLQADLLAPVRAFENGVPFVAANKCGSERGIVAYCGKSQIVRGDGTIAALASQDREEPIFADIQIGSLPRERSATPPLSPRTPPTGTSRIAFSIDVPPFDVSELLQTLDANEWIDAHSAEVLDARIAHDPTVLPAFRSGGIRRIVLRSDEHDEWLERIARARAAELRMYVIVFDLAASRAYAVDPDGVVIAGTFDGLRVASCAIDYARTQQTLVAPGTDIDQGYAAVARLAESAPK